MRKRRKENDIETYLDQKGGTLHLIKLKKSGEKMEFFLEEGQGVGIKRNPLDSLHLKFLLF